MANFVKNIITIAGNEQEIKALFYMVGSSISRFDFEQVIQSKVFQSGQLVEVFKLMYVRLTRWGTTGNAQDIVIDGNVITFVTLKHPPHRVLQELAELFPDLEINHKWADECIGINCGEITYYRGNTYIIQADLFSQEAYALYTDCWGKSDKLETDKAGRQQLSDKLIQLVI